MYDKIVKVEVDKCDVTEDWENLSYVWSALNSPKYQCIDSKFNICLPFLLLLMQNHYFFTESWGRSKGQLKLHIFSKIQICGGTVGQFWPLGCRIFYAIPIKPPFFRLRRTWLNGSISPPYPEVTLDNFSFPVDSHLAARLVVLWPPMAKVTIDKVKNVF